MLFRASLPSFTASDTRLNAETIPERALVLVMYVCWVWFIAQSVCVLTKAEVPDLNYWFFHTFHFGLYVVWIKICAKPTKRKFFWALVQSSPVFLFKGLFVVVCFSASDFLAYPALAHYHLIPLALGNPSNILLLYFSMFQLDWFYGIAFFGYAFANAMFFLTTQLQLNLGEQPDYYKGENIKVRIGLSCAAFSMLCSELFLNMNTYTRRGFWVGEDKGPISIKRQVLPDPVSVNMEPYHILAP